MSEAADHPAIARDGPAIRDALVQAASAQRCNMATLAGPLLQRTRCLDLRDRGWRTCNKRPDVTACAFVAQFVEVRVPSRTREIRVPRLLGALPTGWIVDPVAAHSQSMVGVI